MKHRGLTLILATGCVILGVIAAIICLQEDNSPPKIKIEERDITYTEGEGYEALMDGVSAKDNVDGDLTGKVFVSKIVRRDMEANAAIVYYGVMDTHKNIGTARRRVNYRSAEDIAQDAAQNQGEAPLQPDGPRPAMALTVDQMTIARGDAFDPLSVVREVIDDTDDVNTLYQNIRADGQYDTRTRGSYEIRYYVVDTDGNASDPHIFTLTVE